MLFGVGSAKKENPLLVEVVFFVAVSAVITRRIEFSSAGFFTTKASGFGGQLL